MIRWTICAYCIRNSYSNGNTRKYIRIGSGGCCRLVFTVFILRPGLLYFKNLITVISQKNYQKVSLGLAIDDCFFLYKEMWHWSIQFTKFCECMQNRPLINVELGVVRVGRQRLLHQLHIIIDVHALTTSTLFMISCAFPSGTSSLNTSVKFLETCLKVNWMASCLRCSSTSINSTMAS